MNKYYLIITALFFALISSSVFATRENPFLSYGKEIPSRLLEKNQRIFGKLNLPFFILDMQSVKIIEADAVAVPMPDDQIRSSAMWQRTVAGCEITVSQNLWEPTPEKIRPLLALHEYLGCAGFADRHYSLSSALWLLAQPESFSLNSAEKNYIFQYITQQAALEGGGIIGVGGGGDLGGPWVKQIMLEETLKKMSRANSPEERSMALGLIKLTLDMEVENKWQVRK